MGTKQSNLNSSSMKNREELNRNQFEFLYVIGKGGFGKVWKVNHKKTKKLFALKEMSKAKIIDKKSEKSIKYEKELLCRLKHPFIVNMQFAFQDYENLYLVMDLLTGGDLRYHISRHKKFSEEQTRFFVACLLLGLEYIHHNNVLHRDIKPENLVLDERGYVRITDFGIAKVYQKDNSSETSGTPGYMSPEVMCAQNHTIAVDYFAVGVIAYEFMNGKRPYVGKSRKEIKEQIMAKQVQIKPEEVPEGWSQDAADLINKLLQRKPSHRLGLRGAAEVKEHPWLKYYPWKELYEKKLDAPFIPKIGDNFDKKYCEGPDKIGDETKERYEKYVRDENFQIVFKNFTVFNIVFNDDENNTTINKSKGTNNHKNQSAKYRKDLYNKDNISNSNSTTKVRPMHMRSSSVSVPSSALLNHNLNGNNYVHNSNYNSNNNILNNNNNNNNNLNSTIIKSKVKIIDRESRSGTNLGNSLGVNASSTLRSSIGTYHKHTQSYNNLYGNIVQMNNSNSNFIPNKLMDKSSDKKSTPLLQDSNKTIKMPNNKLPNINNIDKNKLKKLINSSSSNLLFKYYKQSSHNSNNSTGASLTNHIFGKKNLGIPGSYSNYNQ